MKRAALLKTLGLPFLLLAGLAQPALAGEPDLSSPYDKNPKCTERSADANAPDCVIQSEGEPRQKYPPPRQVTPPAPNPPAPPPGAGASELPAKPPASPAAR